MSGTTVDAPSLSTLFVRLLDDAGLFPPGNAPMPDAVDAYLRARSGEDAPYIGSFVVPWQQVGALRGALPDGDRLDLALTVPEGAEALPAAVASVADDARLTLRALELPAGHAGVPLTLDTLDTALPPEATAYVEVPLDGHVPANALVVAAAGRRVKLRAGGTTPDAFPSARRLAIGILGCTQAAVPFKMTAGLHHALRHRDDTTGFEHHGFLNVMAAAAAAARTGRLSDVEGLLESTDPDALASWALDLSLAETVSIRSMFVGFGTCSTHEPLTDLLALGLLPGGRP